MVNLSMINDNTLSKDQVCTMDAISLWLVVVVFVVVDPDKGWV